MSDFLRLIDRAGTDLDDEGTLQEVLDKVLEWAERIFDLSTCAVLLYDEDEGCLRIVASRGYRPDVVATFRGRPSEGVTGRAFSTGRTVHVDDVRGLPDYVEGVSGATAELAVPLTVGGRTLGVLDAETARPGELRPERIGLFDLFAGHVAAAVHNRLLRSEAEDEAARMRMKARDLAALNEAGLQLTRYRVTADLLRGVMATARRVLPFQACAMLLLEHGDLVVRGVYGYGRSVGVGYRMPRHRGISWRCLETGSPMLVPDVSAESDYIEGVLDCRCMMAVPIQGPDGPVGVFCAESPKAGAFDEDSIALFAAFVHQAAAALENARLYEMNQETFYQTITALAQALEMRDPYTLGHSKRVTYYAVRVAERMGFPAHQIEVLRQAGLLHDIGKIGVRDSVLLKPGRLTSAERAAINRHPDIGDSILNPVESLHEALDVIRVHHEYWDGSGYPNGLRGEDIPPLGRVVAVADAYDAMTSRRPYREAMPIEDAIAEIRRLSGVQFDPAVVDAFLDVIDPECLCAEAAEA